MLITAKLKEKERIINERNFEIITNMYKKGFNFETILEIVNLSVDKIKEILKL